MIYSSSMYDVRLKCTLFGSMAERIYQLSSNNRPSWYRLPAIQAFFACSKLLADFSLKIARFVGIRLCLTVIL